MNDRMSTRDIHIRHTATDGKSHVLDHRVWDSAKFVASLQREASNLNADSKDPTKRQAKVELITEDQYQAERA
jgi:hypothetical protein